MTADSILFNPTDLVIELSTTQLEQAWLTTQGASNNSSRWQSYLNRLALDSLLGWIQTEEDEKACLGLDLAYQADIWETVNGSVINLKDSKVVVIPTETVDHSELRIPQEWVDIPEWVADYYLAVEVNVDAGYLNVWGYTTHQQVKSVGNLNYDDRTYTIDEQDLITDLNVLWLTKELCPQEITKTAVTPIPTISDTQADNLIERLGSKTQLLPRLAVPFVSWAALIQNPNCCRRLVQTRRGVSVKTPVLQWLQQGIDNLATELGWRQIQMTPNAIGSRGVTTPELTNNTIPDSGLAKQIAIAGVAYELKILPLEEIGSWRFELSCITPGCIIPVGYKLRLLDADLQSFPNNEDIATEPVAQLFLEVDLDPGECLVWEIEPTPDNYQLEILQF